MKTILYVVLTFTIPAVAIAASEHEHAAPAKANQKFEQLKKLVGTWEGKTMMGDKEQALTATYELSSGGNLIIEKIFAGTPHEMVSIYRPDGDSVKMTHYCMLGNEPQMKLKKADATSFGFEMAGNTGIKSAKEMHMHALNIKWNAEGGITQEWTSFNKGKKQETKIFNLSKKL